MNNNAENIIKEIHSMSQPLAVFSTVSEAGKPESATMYYLCDESLNIFFVTRYESRKYKNLMKNPSMAFVLTSELPPKTVQVEGTAAEVIDPQEQVTYFDKLIAKANEGLALLPVEQIPAGEMVFMKMTPTWIRYGNFELMKEGDKFVQVDLV
jgi:uncharacterized pyridoxamine 5'-phosphate oxidase family protein